MLRDRVLSEYKGDLYKDLAFPANDDSLFFNYSTPLAHFRGEICWLRPQEICSTPRLFSDNQYEWQVKQGMLGDCWFLCACAALQKSKFLLAKISKTGGPILSSTDAGAVLPQRIGSPIQMNLHRWCNCWCNYVGCRKDAVKRICGTRRVSGCSKHALQHLYDTLRSYTSGVIPPGQPSWRDEKYKGCFTCRIWQFGHWVEVTIDDRLPCLGGKLCFSQCQTEDVFWLPLLEKAYAKVHGSYEQLWAGQVADALVDLTGGLAERWALKDPGRSTEKERASKVLEKVVFRRLMNLKEKCVMSCSVFSSRQGTSDLGEFHAFIVVDMQDLSKVSGKEIVLLRIRNPWGRRCWKGPWREGGPGWSQLDPVVAAELLSQIQEGEFWVEEEEFFVEFDEVITGYPITEEGQLQSLYTDRVLSHTQKLYGSWVRGQSAGGCRNNSTFPMNPKFWLRVCEQSEVCIALLQKHRKYSTDWAGRIRNWPRLVEPDPSVSDGIRGKNYHAVGLHIWKVEKKQFNLSRTFSAPPISGTVCHSYNREVHLHCSLSPGYYLVVPSTFLNGAEGNFLLRVFSSGRISLSETKLPAPDNATREEVVGGEWETARLEGCWRKGQNAGGSRNFPSFHTNPCFPFRIPAGVGPSSIKVALRQHCPDNKCCPIGFHIFQVPCDNNNVKMPPASFLHLEPLVSCVPHCYSQEVSQLCRLPSGNYAIVPSTYLPDTEGSFTVIIATKIDRKSIRIQETLGQRLQEVAFKAVMKM